MTIIKREPPKVDIDPNLPTGVLYYAPHYRSFLYTEQFRYLRDRKNKKFNLIPVYDVPSGITLDRVSEYYGLREPLDFVMLGPRHYDGLLQPQTYEYINKCAGVLKQMKKDPNADVKLIQEVVDIEWTWGWHSNNFNPINAAISKHYKVDAFYFPMSPETPAVEFLSHIIEDHITQRDADYICVPFGIDTNKYKPVIPFEDRGLDAIALYSMFMDEPFQQNRVYMAKTLKEMAKFEDTDIEQYKEHVGVFLDRTMYLNNMANARAGVGDTTMRGYMTNKYLEMMALGVGVFGDVPIGYDDLFEEGESILGCNMYDLKNDFPKIVKKYIIDEKEDGMPTFRDIAKEGRKRVEKYNNLELITSQLENDIMAVIS